MKKVLIATTNPGKIREFQDLLTNRDLELITPRDLKIEIEVVEDGSTYAQNAARKALAYAAESGLITLADDSGLEVEVLDGAPGIHSARFSSLPGATDADRRAALLQALEGKPAPWKARFHATIAIAFPDGRLVFAEGECDGEIIAMERGSNGFGYDPIFFIPEMNKTMAELSREEKNQISHRARAAKSAMAWL
ncbi:MAG TPA: RdgB/HAM1 family non-canonical purine NTP pyrophosphatase [Anaerolineales bacterium]|nr:RdgB/HAM1 family non-canonical purine NTP pyrophosphatase [Anaerolineales bacterium]